MWVDWAALTLGTALATVGKAVLEQVQSVRELGEELQGQAEEELEGVDLLELAKLWLELGRVLVGVELEALKLLPKKSRRQKGEVAEDMYGVGFPDTSVLSGLMAGAILHQTWSRLTQVGRGFPSPAPCTRKVGTHVV